MSAVSWETLWVMLLSTYCLQDEMMHVHQYHACMVEDGYNVTKTEGQQLSTFVHTRNRLTGW